MSADIYADITTRIVAALVPYPIYQACSGRPIPRAFKHFEIHEAKAQNSTKIRCVDLCTHIALG